MYTLESIQNCIAMKLVNILRITVLVFLFCNCTGGQESPNSQSLGEEHLLVAIKKFNKVFEKGDPETLESMIT